MGFDAHTIELAAAGQRAVDLGRHSADLRPGTVLGREWYGHMQRVKSAQQKLAATWRKFGDTVHARELRHILFRDSLRSVTIRDLSPVNCRIRDRLPTNPRRGSQE